MTTILALLALAAPQTFESQQGTQLLRVEPSARGAKFTPFEPTSSLIMTVSEGALYFVSLTSRGTDQNCRPPVSGSGGTMVLGYAPEDEKLSTSPSDGDLLCNHALYPAAGWYDGGITTTSVQLDTITQLVPRTAYRFNLDRSNYPIFCRERYILTDSSKNPETRDPTVKTVDLKVEVNWAPEKKTH